ncbi:hypothetical protein BGZ76_000745 [Entomortierella beljakovae]|nr:hypothetical protein BGZ76_000745 [Entomortierella beljakovae]
MECNPRVLIVGAGIGGIFLAILLQHAGIEYEIFERASQVKSLGSAMVTGPNILPVFEQLGLLEEVEKISKPLKCLNIYGENMNKLGSVDANSKERAGYHSMAFPRKSLLSLLLSQIPPHKIHFSKKVLAIEEVDDGITIRCSDKSCYIGDILVGADGAYSGVRQSMYKQMARENLLPKIDNEELSMRYTCLVGTTDALDVENHPYLADEFCHFEIVLASNSSESVACFTVPDNKICWVYTIQLPSSAPYEYFRNSEWGPEAAQAMCERVRDVKAPFGLTMGQLIDSTPIEAISKMLPSAGQGAINAMQDATILANCINSIKTLTVPNISAAFQDYQSQRYQFAKTQFDTSKRFAVIMGGQTWTDAVIRKIVLSYLPKSLNVKRQDKTCAYRPQANFLKQVPIKGSIPVLPQAPPKQYTISANSI